MPFYDLLQTQSKEMAPGVIIRPIWGEKVMMVHITLEDGAVDPLHSHPHEQMGMGLEGEFELSIAGEKRVVKQGDAYFVPSGVEHIAVANRGRAIALDIFSPPREDFIQSLSE